MEITFIVLMSFLAGILFLPVVNGVHSRIFPRSAGIVEQNNENLIDCAKDMEIEDLNNEIESFEEQGWKDAKTIKMLGTKLRRANAQVKELKGKK